MKKNDESGYNKSETMRWENKDGPFWVTQWICTDRRSASGYREAGAGFKEGNQFETLLGVTGSGKTFTMANVIQQLNKPTLILAHNKTLAAQLYGEMKEFFPHNAVEYFVSYYDYYQPEAMYPLQIRI